MPAGGYVFGSRPGNLHAAIDRSTANICFDGIDTPLKAFLLSRANVVQHCRMVDEAVEGSPAESV